MSKKTTVRDEKKRWNNLTNELVDMSVSHRGKNIDIGVFAEKGSHLVKYATANEFGTKSKSKKISTPQQLLAISRSASTGGEIKHIPERSYLRGAVDNNTKKIEDFMKKEAARAVKKAAKGSRGAGIMAYKRIGLFAETLVKKRIKNSKSWAHPNSPSTIKRKTAKYGGKKDQPLVATGRLINSIVYRIR